MQFRTNDKLLFIGDSITHAGKHEDQEQLGNGYVREIRDALHRRMPELGLTILNQGIGGNRVTDLAGRWEEDVLRHQPDWLTVSVGINDVWRQIDSPHIEQVLPDRFREVYRGLLTHTREHSRARIVLVEPTVISEDPHAVGNALLKEYVRTVGELAVEFNALRVPAHHLFLNWIAEKPKELLTTDGVHLSHAGSVLLAEGWLRTVMVEEIRREHL
jgi:lysophospholipase L1-like esterase